MIHDPARLAAELGAVPAIAAHGLFLGVADAALIADGANVYVLHAGLTPVALKLGESPPLDFARRDATGTE